MKGHMEKDGFHPHTESKGVRKSRDQQAKQEGVKIRKARYIVSYKNVFTKGKWESAVVPYSSLASAEAGAEYLRSKSYPTSRDWTGAKRPRIKTVTKIEVMK